MASQKTFESNIEKLITTTKTYLCESFILQYLVKFCGNLWTRLRGTRAGSVALALLGTLR